MKHSAFAQDGAGPWSADLPVVPRSYGSSGELDVIALVRLMEAVILPPGMLVLWDREASAAERHAGRPRRGVGK